MSDFYFLTYDPDEMWNAMEAAYRRAGGGMLIPGDNRETLLRGVQAILMHAYAATDVALKMNTLRYATGDYLKLYGAERDVEYLDAEKAGARAAVSLAASTIEISLPVGTKLRDEDGLIWTTLDAVTHPAGGAAEYIIRIECDTAGSAADIRKAGDPLLSVKGSGKITRCIFSTDAAGGRDAEEEEEYRERIRYSLFRSATTGPKEAYEAIAKEAASGIIDVKAVNGGAGLVNVYLLTESGADVEEIKAAVLEKLNADTVRPLTDTVSVDTADDVTYKITIEYALDDGADDALNKMRDAVKEYQAWQEGAIGRAFNPFKLVSMLYAAGAERATIDAYHSFCGDGPCEYTEMEENEHLTGSVVLTEV